MTAIAHVPPSASQKRRAEALTGFAEALDRQDEARKQYAGHARAYAAQEEVALVSSLEALKTLEVEVQAGGIGPHHSTRFRLRDTPSLRRLLAIGHQKRSFAGWHGWTRPMPGVQLVFVCDLDDDEETQHRLEFGDLTQEQALKDHLEEGRNPLYVDPNDSTWIDRAYLQFSGDTPGRHALEHFPQLQHVVARAKASSELRSLKWKAESVRSHLDSLVKALDESPQAEGLHAPTPDSVQAFGQGITSLVFSINERLTKLDSEAA